MKNFSPGLTIGLSTKMKLREKSLKRIKMAPRTRIVKISALLLSQFGLLSALNFQLFGIAAYKMMELNRNLSLAVHLSARKTYLQRKRRYFKLAEFLNFLIASYCLTLSAFKVDVHTLSFEIREAMTKILYFITTEMASASLRQPYCFLVFSPG